MVIKSLELSNFRNYEKLSIDFSDKINIIYGNNAQGKTNILEAVYLCSTTKSLRAGREKELIRFSQDEAHIRMYVGDEYVTRKIDMHLKSNSHKGVAIDGIPVTKAAELYGMVNIISFSPDDLSMVKSGPAERRRFIDMELCQLDRSYMYNLSGYNKVLLQRNNLLKQIETNRELKSTLDVWDGQLASYGRYVIESRVKFIKELLEIAVPIHSSITGGEETLDIKYVPNSPADRLEENIFLNHDRDMILQTTGVGPHRDDMTFFINGEDARKYGSQGQQRTIALSLKLAEIELVKKRTHNNPVLLLDDVLSELDRSRQTQLLESINDIQTMITCTGLEEFVNNRVKYNRIYKVENGTVEMEDYNE